MVKFEVLDATHDRQGFDCGVEVLNQYLSQTARQHLSKGVAKTFVFVDADAAQPKPVLGFFTISLREFNQDEVPPAWAKRLPRKIPAMSLGRLAVARMHQGAGYGKALLVEALYRVAGVDELAGGGVGLFVNAKDEAAAAFYRHFRFEETSAGPFALFLPMETLRQLVNKGLR